MSKFDFVKSSYSNTSGECVEVALNVTGIVAVRDSKDPIHGPILRLAPQAWVRFAESWDAAGQGPRQVRA
ncbi:DUF397 domain-containing protein [Streptomyces coelicoflavus]|uniref:DUF397 domain-containing protein n=1 Tax=Streptomyces coelicoflavus TaxID=285562 RepID=UPI0024ACD39E|nr:DUF397 domain-containing protein [Streptomyces coelicoflavus]MDI6517334.1 DUF397 domain-containing protein [Streptomyces coelicoflavus]